MEHPIFIRKLDRASVLGEFKIVGSTDPHVLETVRQRVLAPSRSARMFGWAMLIGGVLIGLTIIGLMLTIVFVPMGLWSVMRAGHNFKVVDAVMAEITGVGLAPA